ncbi:MAG: single-stranded-DNA-specific exonuclease RecJ [Bacteroidota bacterium]
MLGRKNIGRQRESIVEYRWNMDPPAEPEAVRRLAAEINVPQTIATILVNRGVDTFEKAKAYFRPTLGLLHDPFLMSGMDRAVSRVLRARGLREKILLLGDYDVDGTNGSAMLYLFLKSLDFDVMLHIPDRIKEGYGLSRSGIDRGKEFGATLLIAVDCGITAIDQVGYAASLGFEVIICDHHEPTDRMPSAHAVLDPLKPGCLYPFKGLCGCGIAFKLIQGICKKLIDFPSPAQYLDFVSIATSADIVPLNGENRTLAKLGLELINDNPRPGIKALIESAGLKPGAITTGQIVFVIAPRINAVGRLGDAMRAVNLLTCASDVEAATLAQVLEEENRNRRKIDEDTFLKAQELVENCVDTESPDFVGGIVLHHEHWHPGVIGIVASRLVEKYYRPTIMMTTVEGVAKGSARSVDSFDIYQALKRCEDKMIQFGGHKYAAGLAVALNHVDEFREAFNVVVRELLTEDQRTPKIKIDAQLTLREVTPRFVRILDQFAPFGPKNPRPVFLTHNVEIAGTPRTVGRGHLRFKVREGALTFDAIGFNLGHLIERIEQGRKNLDIVFSIGKSEWSSPSGYPSVHGKERETVPQLKIKDLK